MTSRSRFASITSMPFAAIVAINPPWPFAA
jgi:hypothetical protein